MNRISLFFVALITLMLTNCSTEGLQKSPFRFTETDQGIGLSENGKPVFFYQRKPKSLTGQYVCSNYIHPLYDLNGDTLTQEFPPDHPYHRGIFWTWHQLYVDNVSLGDGWINDGISQDVVDVKTEKNKDIAKFTLEVMWKSAGYHGGEPFMEEHTIITVHSLKSDLRKIDFEITLKPKANGLKIGGSADEKGYGGFCVRIKLPDSLIFTSATGRVTPQELQINAGSWMDFSGDFGRNLKASGLTILCHPDTPGCPEPWILRKKGSMQNVVFPGRNLLDIPSEKPVILRYRIIIHNGSVESLDIPLLLSEYAKLIHTPVR